MYYRTVRWSRLKFRYLWSWWIITSGYMKMSKMLLGTPLFSFKKIKRNWVQLGSTPDIHWMRSRIWSETSEIFRAIFYILSSFVWFRIFLPHNKISCLHFSSLCLVFFVSDLCLPLSPLYVTKLSYHKILTRI